ncbi:TatD family hydrolase [Fibrella sp. HMF5335]|uniref:TatD family hydrolase n=1 Tax=Fibrella rubiginis TaxID=2817060 RepID=A0A939GHR2_9BACT|nr:TatD family hydrolase [Fibrella rubiginis]MBO0936996.1 TatD family hydrolase [Fibrella rubiginis]
MLTFIDTHAHAYDDKFEADKLTDGQPHGTRDDMLQRAFAAGVSEIWMPNCAADTIPGMMALATQYPDRCRPMMGLHPTYVNETVDSELAEVEKQLNAHPFLAVGEIGLDFYWDMTFVDQQFMAFETQLRWAAERGMFVSLHTRSGHDRNAMMEAADLIQKLALPAPKSGIRGIFHCFVGTLDEARRAIDMGFMLGIGGVATYKNGGLDKVIPHIGLDHLVLETDAPYLAPVPFRGKRNEPAYVPYIAARLADMTGKSVDEVAEVTTRNAKLMYNV